jgi:hypothetical protein
MGAVWFILRRRRGLALAIARIFAAAAILAGCGGGKHVNNTRPARRSSAPYTWLVPTAGSQRTVVTENRNRGTRDWRLPGPAADVGGLAHGPLSAYVSRQALAPGQTERVFVSAPGSSSVRIRIFRIGWYGGLGGREVLASNSLRVASQPPCAHNSQTGLTECHWVPTLSFEVPPALPSGVYIVKSSSADGVSDCLFVVRSIHPQPLIAQLPTSTYEAYNAWGGDSLYPGGSYRVGVTGTNQGVEVSYDRPYDSITGAGQFFARDVATVWFLERYGYPVSYTTSESVDEDPGQLRGARAVIDFGHSEYWSAGQRRAFAQALSAGESLLFLGSDTLAWRVRYTKGAHVIVSYKEHAAIDPDRAQPTGAFADRGAELDGSAYLGCITPRLSQPGPPTYHYYSWSPAPGLKPAWLFANTGITAQTKIPGIVGYEVDQRTAQTPAGTQLVGSGTVPCTRLSRIEPGEPIPGPGDDLAETTLYTAPSGAIVFDTGTLGWELGLEPVPSASPDAPRAPDPRVVAMTRNLLAHVLGSSAS